MIGWVVLAAYVVGWLWTARLMAIRAVDSEARTELERREEWRKRFKEPHRDDGKPLVDREDRVMNLVMGLLVGVVWPLILPFLALAASMRIPTEVAEAQRQELESLRKLAREHGLPMPGGES